MNAWNKTLTEDELTSFSSCEQNQDTLRNGNILSRKHKWTFPSGSLIKETDFDLADFFCIEHKKNRVVPIPIKKDKKPAMVDICQKFGSSVTLAGAVRSLEDMKHLLKTTRSSKRFQKACGFADNGRLSTWIPYTVNSSYHIVHDTTGEVFDLGEEYFAFWWKGPEEMGDQVYLGMYFGKMVGLKSRMCGYEAGWEACVMCLIPSSLESTTVVRLRGL